MRTIQTTAPLLIIVLLVTSCISNEIIMPTEVSPTVTISSSPTQLPSQVFHTPLPTLTNDRAKELVRELLENNAGCRLPCWWGITPGKTTWVDARHFLESFALYIGETGGVRIPLPDPYSDATYLEHGYFINNGIVEYIHIFNFNLAPNYYLPKFLELYGQPDEIYVRTFAKAEMGIQNYTVDLFYQNLGILIEYSTGEPLKDIDGKLQNCLIKDMDSPFMFLWSPEELGLTFQDAKQKFLDTSNLPEPRPLLEATGMVVKTFYETFKNPDTNACLETPINLWP